MSGTSSSGPGAIKVAPGDLELNADRGPSERGELTFTNVADRPIQIGSHIHLPDVNPGLEFDRSAAQGFRLDIASGTSRPVRAGRLPYGRDRRAAGPPAGARHPDPHRPSAGPRVGGTSRR